jgi:N-acetylglucosamine transport system substrate-binding protein
VDKGYWVPGGAGTQYTQAQASWSNDQDALLYFSGAWIENEMKDVTKEGFEMTAWPSPLLDPATAKLPFESFQLAGGEHLVIPEGAKNPAGAKELLRSLLSRDVAEQFAKQTGAMSVVKGVIPDDGWGSTALASEAKLLNEAGANTMPSLLEWASTYGISALTEWNSFLSGDLTVEELASQLQKMVDDAAADSSIPKTEYTAP